jgi:hypothetical protein
MLKTGSTVAGGTLSQAESCASLGIPTTEMAFKAKSVRGIELAPRKARRKALEAQEKALPVFEVNAGQIWDFWAAKANRIITRGVGDNVGPTFDNVTDVILGKPKLSEADERKLKKEQDERLRRQQRAARKQRDLLKNMKEAVFGKGKTQEELDEEIRLQEESILQAEQLERLQRKFQGELTLM